jgi:late competence protein required for DNA uptake (superfamily II DNA/RNA helicase)
MKKTGFSEEQIVKMLRKADASPVAQVAKKRGKVACGVCATNVNRSDCGQCSYGFFRDLIALQRISSTASLTVCTRSDA